VASTPASAVAIHDIAVSLEVRGRVLTPSARTFTPAGTLRGIAIYLSGVSLHPSHCATAGRYDNLGHAIAALGYAVISPDYLGYGESFGRIAPTYLNRDFIALDAAALLHEYRDRLEAAGRIGASLEVSILGYSQGAAHAMALHGRCAQSSGLAPRLFVGGGIYNLKAQFDVMMKRGGYALPELAVFMLGSLAGPQQALEFLAPQWRDRARAFFESQTWDLGTLNGQFPQRCEALFDASVPAGNGTLNALLEAHSVAVVPGSRIYHARNDELCFAENLEQASGYEQCDILWGEAPSHMDGAPEYFEAMLEWLG